MSQTEGMGFAKTNVTNIFRECSYLSPSYLNRIIDFKKCKLNDDDLPNEKANVLDMEW